MMQYDETTRNAGQTSGGRSEVQSLINRRKYLKGRITSLQNGMGNISNLPSIATVQCNIDRLHDVFKRVESVQMELEGLDEEGSGKYSEEGAVIEAKFLALDLELRERMEELKPEPANMTFTSTRQDSRGTDEEPLPWLSSAAGPAPEHGPYFDSAASGNVTALAGHTARLNCRVHNLGNRTVSWIRHRDIHLLTSGRMTYTSDQRFVSVHNPHTEDWTLKIRFPQRRDSGTYECQVGSTPPIGHSMYLSVVEPITTIVGGPELFINTGSTLNLTCIVRHSPEPPPAIYWTHNNEEINYDSARGGVSVITEKGELTTSYLLVQRARAPDSGRYACAPTNANPRTVLVHVLNGEHPAAMQHGGQLRLEYPFSVALLSIVVAICGC